MDSKRWLVTLVVGSVVAGGLALSAAPAGAAAASNWTQPGGDGSRRSWNQSEATLTPSNLGRLRPGWAAPLRSDAEPVIADGRLFTVEVERVDFLPVAVKLRARDADTGRLLWLRTVSVDNPTVTQFQIRQPIVAGRRVLLQAGSKLRALDVRTGETVWRAYSPTDRAIAGLAAEGQIVAWVTGSYTGGGDVQLLDVASGRQIARSGNLGMPTGAVGVRRGVAYVGTADPLRNGGGSLTALDSSARLLWRAATLGDVRGVALTDDVAYAGVYFFEGDLDAWTTWALDLRTGTTAFRNPRSSQGWASAVERDRLFGPFGVVDRRSGKSVPYRGVLSEAHESSGTVVANGFVIDNRCVTYVPQIDDLPWVCGTWTLEAFRTATGEGIAMPDVEDGRPIVANGRLYVHHDAQVWMYELP